MAAQPLVHLARLAVEAAVLGRGQVDLEDRALRPDRQPEGTGHVAGVFVSIKAFGELRGSAGTLSLADEDLVAAVARYAVTAATRDERFVPVSPAELPLLSYAVDLFGERERIADPRELDPGRWALLVEAGERHGLLPPGVEGIDNGWQQLAAALASAGIAPDEPLQLYRIPVWHLAEPEFDRRRTPVDDDDE